MIGSPRVPADLTCRTRICVPSGACSIQLTSASPEGRATMSTLPTGLPLSTRMGEPKVLPLSLDRATFTCEASLGAVNHAAATWEPAEETAGPFTGHPLICQLSFDKASGFDHPSFVNRA